MGVGKKEGGGGDRVLQVRSVAFLPRLLPSTASEGNFERRQAGTVQVTNEERSQMSE